MEQTQQESETPRQPEESLGLEFDFENAFDHIGEDIEAGCREVENSLNSLDF